MKYLKMLGFALLTIVALLACAAGSSSATTLELSGAKQNQSISIEAVDESNTVWETTTGLVLDICSEATIKGKTESPFTGIRVGGNVSTLAFGSCSHTTHVVSKGSLSIEWTKATEGTVRSSGTLVEVEDTFLGIMLECSTSDTDLGLLTGVASGHATLEINAVINCGFLRPSVSWLGAYTIESPTGLGVGS